MIPGYTESAINRGLGSTCAVRGARIKCSEKVESLVPPQPFLRRQRSKGKFFDGANSNFKKFNLNLKINASCTKIIKTLTATKIPLEEVVAGSIPAVAFGSRSSTVEHLKWVLFNDIEDGYSNQNVRYSELQNL